MNTSNFKKGDIVGVKYLYRGKLRTELWKWDNYNKNTKEYWFYNEGSGLLCLKESKLIAIEKAPIGIDNIS